MSAPLPRGTRRAFLWIPTGRDLASLSPKEYDRRLKDDALCRWNRLLLRYEQLDRGVWWWAVSGPSGGVNKNGVPQRAEIASSWDRGTPGKNHESAALMAEGAAFRYLVLKSMESARVRARRRKS